MVNREQKYEYAFLQVNTSKVRPNKLKKKTLKTNT